MNTQAARYLLDEAARLVELTARFQSRYGRNYALKPGSPDDAWKLYDDILDEQRRIARLLDPESLENPHYRLGRWWERQDVIDMGITQELVAQITFLIGCCAYHEVSPGDMHALRAAQSAIAGLLHPASLQVASDYARSPGAA